MGTVRSIFTKIRSDTSPNRECIVENLCVVVLRELVERYFAIGNGKQMLEIIL